MAMGYERRGKHEQTDTDASDANLDECEEYERTNQNIDGHARINDLLNNLSL
jgi:hypothetical protein